MTKLSELARAKSGSSLVKNPMTKDVHSALMKVARHGRPQHKAMIRRAIEKHYPDVVQKFADGGDVGASFGGGGAGGSFAGDSTKKSGGTDVTGLITQLYGYVRAIGDGFDKDAGKTDQWGEIKDPGKYETEKTISTIIDPYASGMDELNKGNTGSAILDFLGLGGFAASSDVKESKKLAAKNKLAKIESDAAQMNQLGEVAGSAINQAKLSGLKNGGVVKKAKGGIVTGKPGIDTNPATVKDKSFVVPTSAIHGKQGMAIRKTAARLGLYKPLQKRTGGDVPVLLTKGEIVIPPEKRATFEKLLLKQGIPSLESLAPNANNSPGKDDGGEITKRLLELFRKQKSGSLTPDEITEVKTLRLKAKLNNLNVPGSEPGITNGQGPVKDDINPDSQSASSVTPEEKSSNDTSTPNSSADSKKNPNSRYKNEKILGALQTGMGLAGSLGLGQAPIVTPEAERIFNESYDPLGTRMGLNILRQLSYGGLDAKAMILARKNINQTYADDVQLSKESGDSATAFNENSIASIRKNNAGNDLAVKDSESLTQNKTRYAEGLISADPFLASLAERKQSNQLALLQAKQSLWDQQSAGFSKLTGAGLTNIMESDRTGKFWQDYMKYSNPYVGG